MAAGGDLADPANPDDAYQNLIAGGKRRGRARSVDLEAGRTILDRAALQLDYSSGDIILYPYGVWKVH